MLLAVAPICRKDQATMPVTSAGLLLKKYPSGFPPFYKPGKKIATTRDWDQKMEAIVENAPNWDIGFEVGVPAWITDVPYGKDHRKLQSQNHSRYWPNLAFFVHGGVSFEPYKKGFQKLVAKPLTHLETYLAPEGFFAYQDRQFAKGMRLALNDHIFFRFIPINDENFDGEGNVVENPEILMIHEVEEGKDYAILLSTAAGAGVT